MAYYLQAWNSIFKEGKLLSRIVQSLNIFAYTHMHIVNFFNVVFKQRAHNMCDGDEDDGADDNKK